MPLARLFDRSGNRFCFLFVACDSGLPATRPFFEVHSPKTTWNLTRSPFKRTVFYIEPLFRFHVCLAECIFSFWLVVFIGGFKNFNFFRGSKKAKATEPAPRRPCYPKASAAEHLVPCGGSGRASFKNYIDRRIFIVSYGIY